MNIQEWLNYGKDNKYIVILDNYTECEFGFELNFNNINLDTDNFTNMIPWYTFGYNNDWIKNQGCVKHELTNPSASIKYFHHSNRKKLSFLNNEFEKFDTISSLLNMEDGYFPSYPESIEMLINSAQENPCETFIDIGCGLGLPFYIASKYNYYKKYIGIDVDQRYLDECYINNINIQNNLKLYNIDASEYLLPNTKSHIFMFNPFNNKILLNFLKNNITVIKDNNSSILYNNDYIAQHLLISVGFKIIKSLSHNIAIYK